MYVSHLTDLVSWHAGVIRNESHAQVRVFYTAPTLIRALMQHGDEPVKRHDRSSLRVLGTVGEPIGMLCCHQAGREIACYNTESERELTFQRQVLQRDIRCHACCMLAALLYAGASCPPHVLMFMQAMQLGSGLTRWWARAGVRL